MLIIFMEYKATENNKCAFFSGLIIVIASVWLIITRGTYSIDIFGGFLFGHYFWILCEKFSWTLDYEWFRAPFHLRHPAFPKKCSKCLDPIN